MPSDNKPVGEEGRSIHDRMAAVFASLKNLPKTGRNEFHKYDYVTEADMVAAVRPLFAREGLYLLAVDEDVQVLEPGHLLLKVRYVVTAEDGQQVEFIGFGEGRDISSKGVPGDKALYKAKTGALKYALMKSFMVDTGDDPERADIGEASRARAADRSEPRHAGRSEPPRGRGEGADQEADESGAAATPTAVRALAIQARRVASVLEFEGWGKDDAWIGAHQFFARLIGVESVASLKDLTRRQGARLLDLMTSRDDAAIRNGVVAWMNEAGYAVPASQ